MPNSKIKNLNDIYNKQIITTPKPDPKTGIDYDDKIISKVAKEEKEPTGLNSLTTISYSRDLTYQLIDDMLQDSRIASIVETYTEDVACIGKDGRCVYVDSEDSNISKMVTFVLDSLNVDKYIYSWANSLIKYGDVYIRLFRQSDLNKGKNKKLNENIELNYYNSNVDKFELYCEQVLNPAEMFELKQYGKTMAYVQCPISSLAASKNAMNPLSYYVRLKDNNVKLFQPTEFVHGSLNQSSTRVAETIEIFNGDDSDVNGVGDLYTVNRGQSILLNTYQQWKLMQLLENAMLLNRVNNSAILRVMQVEVGNVTNEEDVNSIVAAVSNMLQTKMSLSTKTMSELYMSDTPTINYAVMPTRNGAGALSSYEMGGAPENVDTSDIEYFRAKLYSGLRVPREMFGETTGDSAGFDAGGSLALKSYRYGKSIIRIQNALAQMIQDLVNNILYDRGLINYINKFAIRLHAPVTQEDTTLQAHKKDEVDLISSIMDSLQDVLDDGAKAAIMSYLLSSVIEDSDVLIAIQAELEKKFKSENKESNEESNEENESESESESEEDMNMDMDMGGEEIDEEPTTLGDTLENM